jgi:hypothetical protein
MTFQSLFRDLCFFFRVRLVADCCARVRNRLNALNICPASAKRFRSSSSSDFFNSAIKSGCELRFKRSYPGPGHS